MNKGEKTSFSSFQDEQPDEHEEQGSQEDFKLSKELSTGKPASYRGEFLQSFNKFGMQEKDKKSEGLQAQRAKGLLKLRDSRKTSERIERNVVTFKHERRRSLTEESYPDEMAEKAKAKKSHFLSSRKISDRTERKMSERKERKTSMNDSQMSARSNPKLQVRKTSDVSVVIPPEVQFGPEGYRFLVLGLYCLAASVGSANIVNYSPITKTLAKVYKASDLEIYILTNLYLLSGAILNFPLQLLILRIGRVKAMRIGMALMSIGALLKIFIEFGIGYALGGQIIASIGFEFLHSIIAPITCLWFRPELRTTVFSVSALAYNFGKFMDFVIPLFLISEDLPSSADISAMKGKIKTMQIILAALTLIVLALIFAFFREKPNKPLNPASLVPRLEIPDSIRKLLKNRDYLLVLVGMGSLLSVQLARFHSYTYNLQPFGYSQKEADYLSSIETWGEICGLIVLCVFGRNISRPKRFLRFIPLSIIIFFATTVTLYMFELFLLTALITFLLGITMSWFAPLCQTYGTQVTFPIFENITVGTLISAGLWGSILSSALSMTIRSNFQDATYAWVTFSFFFALQVVALITFNLMEDIDQREEFERE